MPDTDTIVATIDDRGVVTITLNRPDVSNAMNVQMLRTLGGIIDRAQTDPNIRVLCLTAAGRDFCSGADFRSAGKERGDLITLVPELTRALASASVPVVSVVHGACVGLGLGIVATSDLVIAAPDAHFAVPEIRVGLAPLGVLPHLANAIGLRAANRYALTGERIEAERAVDLGLVDAVAPREELADAVLPFLNQLLRGAPGAVAETKAAVGRLRADNFQVPPHDPAAFVSAEAREGTAAFVERRSPSWYQDHVPGSDRPLSDLADTDHPTTKG